jgi:hypothetical protein
MAPPGDTPFRYRGPINLRFDGLSGSDDVGGLARLARSSVQYGLDQLARTGCGVAHCTQILPDGRVMFVNVYNNLGVPLAVASLSPPPSTPEYPVPPFPEVKIVPSRVASPPLFLLFDKYVIEPNTTLKILEADNPVFSGNGWRAWEKPGYIPDGFHTSTCGTVRSGDEANPIYVASLLRVGDEGGEDTKWYVCGYGGQPLYDATAIQYIQDQVPIYVDGRLLLIDSSGFTNYVISGNKAYANDNPDTIYLDQEWDYWGWNTPDKYGTSWWDNYDYRDIKVSITEDNKIVFDWDYKEPDWDGGETTGTVKTLDEAPLTVIESTRKAGTYTIPGDDPTDNPGVYNCPDVEVTVIENLRGGIDGYRYTTTDRDYHYWYEEDMFQWGRNAELIPQRSDYTETGSGFSKTEYPAEIAYTDSVSLDIDNRTWVFCSWVSVPHTWRQVWESTIKEDFTEEEDFRYAEILSIGAVNVVDYENAWTRNFKKVVTYAEEITNWSHSANYSETPTTLNVWLKLPAGYPNRPLSCEDTYEYTNTVKRNYLTVISPSHRLYYTRDDNSRLSGQPEIVGTTSEGCNKYASVRIRDPKRFHVYVENNECPSINVATMDIADTFHFLDVRPVTAPTADQAFIFSISGWENRSTPIFREIWGYWENSFVDLTSIFTQEEIEKMTHRNSSGQLTDADKESVLLRALAGAAESVTINDVGSAITLEVET